MTARPSRQPPRDAPRVIVIGAGFAGLTAVKELHRVGAQVLLIDRNIYSTFQPLLYQVATGGLNPGDVAYPLRTLARKKAARFRPGELAAIDPADRRITLTDGSVLGYDYLVLGTGVSAAYYGVTGAAEHTFGLYTRHDAVALRDHIMARLERLDMEGHGHGRGVHFTVVGGGATGVELAGALAELRDDADAFPEVDRADVHIRLVEMAPALLAPFHPKLQRYALAELRRRGVDVHLDTKISEITDDRVILADGDELPSDVTVWAAGVSAPAEVQAWGLPQGHGGRIEVGPDLRVAGQDRIFATGDVALTEGQPLPQVAQPAIQSGRHAAEQIALLMAGRPTKPFHYHDKGIMATIGRRAAVVQFPHGTRLRGTLAWLAWLGLHLFYLLGGRNRLSALLNLSYRYLVWGHGGGVIVGDDPPAAIPGGTLQALPGAAAGSRQGSA
jgi:NADH:ubiquinone reductase (H+-translocating)